jgi:S-phase kinase-associated protein 1
MALEQVPALYSFVRLDSKEVFVNNEKLVPSHPDVLKLISFLEQEVKAPMPEIIKPLRGSIFDELPPWYQNWAPDMTKSDIISLVNVASVLAIKPLLNFYCARIAMMIKGKRPEQIREMFGIENSFTPEQDTNE